MNKEQLEVANRLSKEIDLISDISNAFKTISTEENINNVVLSFTLYFNGAEKEIAISSSQLSQFQLNFGEVVTNLVSNIGGQVTSKSEELNYRFDNNIFEEEKK